MRYLLVNLPYLSVLDVVQFQQTSNSLYNTYKFIELNSIRTAFSATHETNKYQITQTVFLCSFRLAHLATFGYKLLILGKTACLLYYYSVRHTFWSHHSMLIQSTICQRRCRWQENWSNKLYNNNNKVLSQTYLTIIQLTNFTHSKSSRTTKINEPSS